MRPSNNPSRPSQSQPHPPHPPRLPLPQHLPSHRRRRHRRHRRQPCRPSAPKRSKSSPEVIIIIIIIITVVVVVARPDLPRPTRVPSSLVTMAANWPALTIINTSTNNITNINTISNNNIICRTTAETVSLFVSGGQNNSKVQKIQGEQHIFLFILFFFFSKLCAPKNKFLFIFFERARKKLCRDHPEWKYVHFT